MLELSGGGTSKFRLHSAKDYTGMELMRTLREEAQNRGLTAIEFTPAIELLMDDSLSQVTGGVLFNIETSQYFVVRAKSTILATGGFGRLHIQNYPTTNHYGATADGLVLAYRVGAKLRDLDAVQYHPTGAAYPEQIVGLLISEKVRGLGGQPVNKRGELFVNPLEPRDVESAAFIRECYDRNNGIVTPTGMRGVWLDTPLIDELHGKGTIDKNLAALRRMYQRFGIDVTSDPILVFPTLHYQNGGVAINVDAYTSVPGLFAAGEVSGGVHGKNRLMGNSLLDYNVFGRRAGISAAKHALRIPSANKLSLAHITRYEHMLTTAGIETVRKAPIILPEYRGREVLSRAIDIF
jgi:succinate dehydrogenase / fumarate reductase flavoprotein subunit